MVGGDVADLIGAGHTLLGHGRHRAVGADHGARAHAHFGRGAVVTRLVMHDGRAVGIAADLCERAVAQIRTGRGRALAQPLVEGFAIDDADVAAVDGHVDRNVLRGNHARGVDLRDQQGFRHFELLHGLGRDRATTGLDAPGSIQKQHGAALAGEIVCGRGTGRTAADDYYIECLHGTAHRVTTVEFALTTRCLRESICAA